MKNIEIEILPKLVVISFEESVEEFLLRIGVK